ncbi:H/ACA RNA-protein complex protein Gar1 [Candidatus Bathyarchaeota archaeon]|nr:H/ACA RNA-protein complex protein Gar1 [Candidatus Bathyarchaeota archaeon]
MQRLGRVLHITPSKNIIIKVENTPKLGETVVDENLKSFGTVFDLFGPVSAPYVAVKPTVKELSILADKVLYVLPSARRKER